MTLRACPLCHGEVAYPLHGQSLVPCYLLQRHVTVVDALAAPCGDLAYRFCPRCEFTYNAAFEPSRMTYQVPYEASRSASPSFQAYLEARAADLASRIDLTGKTVVEIGCGDGQFLRALRQHAGFEGHGYDPSLSASSEVVPGVTLHAEAFTSTTVKPDVLIVRHVLEHIWDGPGFLAPLIPTDRSVLVYLEVPAWEWIVQHRSLAAFQYEHCCYYSSEALGQLQRALGAEHIAMERDFNDGEYWCAYFEAGRPKFPQHLPQHTLLAKTLQFAQQVSVQQTRLRQQLIDPTQRTVLWGAGGRGSGLLTGLGITRKELQYVVDSNPARDGTFLPHTGQAVIAPARLQTLVPAVQRIVMVTNAYHEEIRRQVQQLALSPLPQLEGLVT